MHQYFNKHALRQALITEQADPDCYMRIVIPVYKEAGLIQTLNSLLQCHRPKHSFELILLFNASDQDEAGQRFNQKSKEAVERWIAEQRPYFPIFCLEENHLKQKLAGVGTARKIGMDEAARRFYEAGLEEGVILCLDADCRVKENYLQAVEAHFKSPKSKSAASLYFEHPLSGDDHSDEIYEAILYYELHLRYYKHAMRKAGLPFDRYTVGSSMAVRANAYVAEGGMNKRKAGEDFYFLQKYLINGELDEINTTVVYPSPRTSDRVPFGTGRAVKDHLEERKDLNLTYSTRSFAVLAALTESIDSSYPKIAEVPIELKAFLDDMCWEEQWQKMRSQSTDLSSFKKRFFQWLTPFKVLKLLHYLRDNHFANMPIEKAVRELLGIDGTSPTDQLEALRKMDQF